MRELCVSGLLLLLACGETQSSRPSTETERPATRIEAPPRSAAAAQPGQQTVLLQDGAIWASDLPPLAVDAPPRCGAISQRPRGDAIPMLADRLRMQAPVGTVIEPAPWNVMSAPEPEASQSRFFLHAGDEKLVVMAYELFAHAGADLIARVRAEQAFPGTMHKFRTSRGLEAIAVAPQALDLSDEAVHVLALYVVHRDRTVQVVAFYVTPTNGRDGRDGCVAYALQLADTIAVGERALEIGPRTVELVGGPQRLRLDVPAGFVVVTQQGPDFWVHRLRQLVRFGEAGAGGLVYFGGHPSASLRDAEAFSASLFGRTAEWRRAADGRREARMPLSDYWMTHVSTYGAEPAQQELVRALGTATLLP